MPIALRTDFDADTCRRAAKGSKDGPQARRLLALAAIYEGASRGEAARIGGVTVQICPRLGCEVQPPLRFLRQSRRPSLRGLEPPHPSAVEDHVHQHARLGSSILINGTWYKPLIWWGQSCEPFHVRELVADRPRLRLCVVALLTARETLMKQLAALHGELLRVTKNDELWVRFMGISAVGPVTALAVKTTIYRPDRFGRSSDVSAHLGLAPRQRQLPFTASPQPIQAGRQAHKSVELQGAVYP